MLNSSYPRTLFNPAPTYETSYAQVHGTHNPNVQPCEYYRPSSVQ